MFKLATVINIILLIDAIIMIVFIVLQSGTSAGLSGAISGGAEQLFGKQKARGIDLVLHRGTVITAVLFFVLAFISAYVI
ncbi:preprotein translocase subunit SecG [Pseudogracilibacillus sp. SO10305]|uniref:preprotein translocase subunit SecG n=1 Tax=Pseudogracilibacillus sp. SO10305 TaxID=3098292 RepID=UPI003FA70B87